jgi:hypothetical protein
MRKTVKEVCASLGVDLDAALIQGRLQDDNDHSANNNFGSDPKANYGHLIGAYTTIRFAYADPPNVVKCYRTVIDWDAGAASTFVETNRDDTYHQGGHIYIPPPSAFMYLMTIKNGRSLYRNHSTMPPL